MVHVYGLGLGESKPYDLTHRYAFSSGQRFCVARAVRDALGLLAGSVKDMKVSCECVDEGLVKVVGFVDLDVREPVRTKSYHDAFRRKA